MAAGCRKMTEMRHQQKRTVLMIALDEKEARRILHPKHATRIATMERGLHLLGKRVEVVVA
jgi:hypothetical protein